MKTKEVNGPASSSRAKTSSWPSAHLQVCVGPIEGVRLLGSNLRIMDDAFEYLLPTEAKKKPRAT